ncbi:conserved protein of unknown function [Pararobbsia alpina]
MRPLTEEEILCVSGAETIRYELPQGSSVTTKLEADYSTTIHINIPGHSEITWNSGIPLECVVLKSAVTVTAAILARNARVGVLTGRLAARGCTFAMRHMQQQHIGEDGDG